MPPCTRNEWDDNRKEGHKSQHRPCHCSSAEAVLQSINTSEHWDTDGNYSPKEGQNEYPQGVGGDAGKILSPPDYESTHHKQPMIRSATGQQAALAAVNGQICNVLLGAHSISAAHESSHKVSCGHRE